MFKNNLKNFFVSLKHFFTPLGTLFLGLVIGLSVFLPCLYNAVARSANEIGELLQSMKVDFDSMWSSVLNSFANLDWENPDKALELIFSKTWFEDTLAAAVEAAVGENVQLLQDNLPTILEKAMQSISAGLVVLVVCVAAGMLGGHYLTCFLVRRSIAKRAFWKIFLAYFVDTLLNVALAAVCLWLAALWKYSVIFTLLAVAVVLALASLIQAYLLQGVGKVKISEIVNFKNALQHLLSAIVIIGIVVATVVLLNVAINAVVAAVIGFAVFEIAVAVNGLNAEAYVKSVIDKNLPLSRKL